MKTEDLKKALRKKKQKRKVSAKDFLSTGSTLLNLACTGKPNRGFKKGHYYYLVGDTDSGKTFLSLTCLAEASINPNFKDYRFIFDNAEDGALMDIEKFFGKAVASRIEPPSIGKLYSDTIEEFYYHVDDAVKMKRPFIYILDSMDALSSDYEGEKFDEHKTAYRKGRKAVGSYGDGKAKINSQSIRQLLTYLRKSGSILIVISQTRDNLGFGFAKKTRSGGHSLAFYACIVIWSSVKKSIKRTVRSKNRQLGTLCKVQVKRNRLTGRQRSVEMPIYYSFGIDDIGSCVDYLLDEKHWRKSGEKIRAPEFEFKGTRKKFIKFIEKEGLEKDLKDIVSDVWNEIDEACSIKRKRKYE